MALKYDKYVVMAESFIAPVIPNIGLQESAAAGSQAVIFTATDRKIIEERTGELERTDKRSFIEVFARKPIAQKVENEQTTVKPHEDPKELEERYKEHQRILKYSSVYVPRERVEITGKTPDTVTMQADSAQVAYQESAADNYEKPADPNKAAIQERAEMRQKAHAIAKELNLNPAEIFDKFALEQKELYSLIFRIRELHLKRLLTGSREEFEELTRAIKNETLAGARAEAQAWLESQLDALTRRAAEYKLNLIRSLQSLHFDDHRDSNAKWLQILCT